MLNDPAQSLPGAGRGGLNQVTSRCQASSRQGDPLAGRFLTALDRVNGHHVAGQIKYPQRDRFALRHGNVNG